MQAAELLKRYKNGERNFRGVNLRGQSFKGQDLSGCDFSGADIRSTNFSGATLCGANFSGAMAGLQRRWAIGLFFLSWVLAGVAGAFLGYAGYLVSLIFSSNISNAIFGWISLIAMIILLAIIVRKGTRMFAVAFAVAFAGVVVFAGAKAGAVAVAFAVAFAGAVAFAFAVAGAVAFAGAVAVLVAVAGAFAVAFAVFAAVAGAFAGAFAVAGAVAVAVAGAGAVVGAVAVMLVSAYIGCRSLKEDPRDAWIRSLAIAFAAIGGTSFRNANLNNANLNNATLKSTDLRRATLTLTNWHQSKKLDRTRTKGTILLNSKVRDLVVTHRGKGQSYKGADLRGANLTGADLSDADLTEADVSNTTLERAWLERANLTKAQALGTNFHQALLTGACLEEWNIGSTTQLEGAICEYVYLLNGQKERRPSSGNFAPGEFTKLFEEMIDTIDLIFRNGLDWRAFITSFKQVQVENEGVELAIQSIENKGDGVVVVKVKASPDANKEKIHSDFNRNYEAELAALEAQYQAKLEAKDEQIAIYREKSTDMKEIVGWLASRPITPTHITQIETMTHNPGSISQNVTNSPNSNISAIQGNQNQVNQTQTTPQEQLTKDQVIELLAQIKTLIEAADIPSEAKIEANANLKVAQKATEQDEPKKEIALATLESMAETLQTTSKTVEAGKTLWEQLTPILSRVAAWLGAAAGSLLGGL